MNRYWITLIGEQLGVLGLGLGVTARSREDARAIAGAVLGETVQIAEIKLIEDMRDIEQNHVAINMGNHFERGIWWPTGMEHGWSGQSGDTPPRRRTRWITWVLGPWTGGESGNGVGSR